MTALDSQVFLNYNFVEDAKNGNYLSVGFDSDGQSYLRTTVWSRLTIKEKIEYTYHERLALPLIVAFVKKYFTYQHCSKDEKQFLTWKKQMAYLSEKVKLYNKKHSRQIKFRNKLKDFISLELIRPIFQEKVSDGMRSITKKYKISYTPLTKFDEIERFILETLGPTGFYIHAEDSDGPLIKEKIKSKETIQSWLNTTGRTSLLIHYTDIKITKYLAYQREFAAIRGELKGFEKGIFKYNSLSTLKHVELCQELRESEKEKMSNLISKYNK
ncbi:MAG: hypothetical protein VX777_02375 [Chlamydiota bacterium]|nr:hypothetical protein [Chlamydiota bacterium]